MAEEISVGSQDSGEDYGNHHGGEANQNVREQDRFLPIANVSRIMKRVLPANAKIAKDAKETVQECVSEFISFITSEASDKCQRERRKTINGDDLLWAMSTLGFEDYVEPLKIYLHKYREMEGDKGTMSKQSTGDPSSMKREASLVSVPPGIQVLRSSYGDPGVQYEQSFLCTIPAKRNIFSNRGGGFFSNAGGDAILPF